MLVSKNEYLYKFESLCDRRKNEIRNSKDIAPRDIGSTTYYVRELGDDKNDGSTPLLAGDSNAIIKIPLRTLKAGVSGTILTFKIWERLSDNTGRTKIWNRKICCLTRMLKRRLKRSLANLILLFAT